MDCFDWCINDSDINCDTVGYTPGWRDRKGRLSISCTCSPRVSRGWIVTSSKKRFGASPSSPTTAVFTWMSSSLTEKQHPHAWTTASLPQAEKGGIYLDYNIQFKVDPVCRCRDGGRWEGGGLQASPSWAARTHCLLTVQQAHEKVTASLAFLWLHNGVRVFLELHSLTGAFCLRQLFYGYYELHVWSCEGVRNHTWAPCVADLGHIQTAVVECWAGPLVQVMIWYPWMIEWKQKYQTYFWQPQHVGAQRSCWDV